MKYNKILVAIGFNEYSDAVIQSALMQAECSGAVLWRHCTSSITRDRSMTTISSLPVDKREEDLLIVIGAAITASSTCSVPRLTGCCTGHPVTY